MRAREEGEPFRWKGEGIRNRPEGKKMVVEGEEEERKGRRGRKEEYERKGEGLRKEKSRLLG